MKKIVETLADWIIGGLFYDYAPHIVGAAFVAGASMVPGCQLGCGHREPVPAVAIDDALAANPAIFHAHHIAR